MLILCFFARARLNSLRLEEAMGRGKIFYNKTCKLCKQEEEDLLHFMIECPCLEGKRNYEIIDERILEPEKRLIQCLFKQRKYQETEGDRERHGATQRHRGTERHRETQRDTERQRETQRHGETQRDTERHRVTQRDRER